MQDNSKPKHYYRYQMTYPYESNKIYKSRSLNKVAKKCYDEFKKFNDMDEGMFCITNLDKNIEYKLKVKNKRMTAQKQDQTGGNIEPILESINVNLEDEISHKNISQDSVQDGGMEDIFEGINLYDMKDPHKVIITQKMKNRYNKNQDTCIII